MGNRYICTQHNSSRAGLRIEGINTQTIRRHVLDRNGVFLLPLGITVRNLMENCIKIKIKYFISI